jgi:hypothetical protein
MRPGTMVRHLGKPLGTNLTHGHNLGSSLKPKREAIQIIYSGLERPITLEGQHLPFFQRF